MHMKDALDKLIADFQKYAGEYEQKFGKEGQAGINDMKDMLASLDATRKSKDSLSAHLSLAEKCMAYFEKNKLPIVADVEQVSLIWASIYLDLKSDIDSGIVCVPSAVRPVSLPRGKPRGP